MVLLMSHICANIKIKLLYSCRCAIIFGTVLMRIQVLHIFLLPPICHVTDKGAFPMHVYYVVITFNALYTVLGIMNMTPFKKEMHITSILFYWASPDTFVWFIKCNCK
jgi:hypothetical protein